MHLRHWPSLLKAAAKEWSEDKASRHAAALSYYALFSIAPLLIIALAVAGAVFGEEAARGRLTDELGGMLGNEGAQAVQTMIENASKPMEGILSAALGVAALLFGASGAFAQLQDSLDTIWEVRPKPGQGILAMVRKRFLSFGMVLVIAFLLLVSLVVSAGLSALGAWLDGMLPGQEFLMRAVDLAASFAVAAGLFAAIFRFLPDAKIAWGDVWTGAAVTALLFTLGRYLIGLYLGRGAVGSAFGAAGSLVVVLLWVYYSSQILLFGAEFTQVYSARFGSRVVPDDDAEAVTKPEPIAGRPALKPSIQGGPESGGRPDGAGVPAHAAAMAAASEPAEAVHAPGRPQPRGSRSKAGPASMAYGLAVLAAAGASRGALGMARRMALRLARRPRRA